MTLNEIAVSSVAAIVSAVMSATGDTVSATVPAVVAVPSVVETVRLMGAAGAPVL